MRPGVAEAVEDVRRLFPAGRVLLDAERREAYGRDESDLGSRPPDVVVLVERA
jgi:glycolate oxidase